jgi:hypothetical protein
MFLPLAEHVVKSFASSVARYVLASARYVPPHCAAATIRPKPMSVSPSVAEPDPPSLVVAPPQVTCQPIRPSES